MTNSNFANDTDPSETDRKENQPKLVSRIFEKLFRLNTKPAAYQKMLVCSREDIIDVCNKMELL